MNHPVLYHMPESARSRAALGAARLLGVDLEVREVDLFERNQVPEDFVRLNPRCTVPTLNDNGFVITDSHAIATYLADKYGKNEKLYPKAVADRSLVDQRLFFDAVILFTNLRDYLQIYKSNFSAFFNKATSVPEDKKIKAYEALGWLNEYLIPTEWVAGNHITIADIFCVSSVASFQAAELDLRRYPRIENWLLKCKEHIPDFDFLNK